MVQLAGADRKRSREAARLNVDLGAQIIDLNMGCPAKKVCGKLCGSALLSDEPLVARILEAVVRAVSVPVTLKIRTGWDREHRNGVSIARIAETLRHRSTCRAWPHARGFLCRRRPSTRPSATSNPRVRIPVFANGDIDDAAKGARGT